MSGEPKTLTLDEAISALGEHSMELRAETVNPGSGPAWSVHRWSEKEDRLVLVCCYYGTWWEAVSDALGVPVVARDEAAELREENKRLSALVDDLLLAPLPALKELRRRKE